METEHAQWQERDHQGQGAGVLEPRPTGDRTSVRLSAKDQDLI